MVPVGMGTGKTSPTATCGAVIKFYVLEVDAIIKWYRVDTLPPCC